MVEKIRFPDEVPRWINKNKEYLAKKYRGEFIAISGDGIVAHSPHLREVLAQAQRVSKPFSIYSVPLNLDRLRILPLRVRTLGYHEWLPLYPVVFEGLNGTNLSCDTLVDSGADVSALPREQGAELGFVLAPAEIPIELEGVGERVKFVFRELTIAIDGNRLQIPIAWIQDEIFKDIILGRAYVFDAFNIEFKQAEETIIFKKR